MKGQWVILFAGMFMMLPIFGGLAMAEETKKVGVIVVDLQGDFTKYKNGSLAVEGTDEAYIKKVTEATLRLREAGYPIYATQDWHPKEHASFFTNHPGKKAFEVIKLHGKDQVLWPPHCVQGTPGAGILLDEKLFKAVVRKGMDPQFDSYSGFQDDGGRKTEMDGILRGDGIQSLVVYGIATDYCVRATVMDALANGYKVTMIKGLSRGVSPETSLKAVNEMAEKGARILEELDLQKIGLD